MKNVDHLEAEIHPARPVMARPSKKKIKLAITRTVMDRDLQRH
jgi:hypothetical protein